MQESTQKDERKMPSLVALGQQLRSGGGSEETAEKDREKKLAVKKKRDEREKQQGKVWERRFHGRRTWFRPRTR